MTINLFQTPEYKTLMHKYLEDTIAYLFDKNQPFAIACDIRHVTFDPALPAHITESFNDTILFVLSGYTFESAHIENGKLIFEGGFGEENFGSVVTVPLLAIKFIYLGDEPILINRIEQVQYLKEPPTKERLHKKEANDVADSMEALLRNPENQRFLKKKK